jgi:hypothetical protein
MKNFEEWWPRVGHEPSETIVRNYTTDDVFSAINRTTKGAA